MQISPGGQRPFCSGSRGLNTEHSGEELSSENREPHLKHSICFWGSGTVFCASALSVTCLVFSSMTRLVFSVTGVTVILLLSITEDKSDLDFVCNCLLFSALSLQRSDSHRHALVTVPGSSEISLTSQWGVARRGSSKGPSRITLARHSRMMEGAEPGTPQEYHRHASPSPQ